MSLLDDTYSSTMNCAEYSFCRCTSPSMQSLHHSLESVLELEPLHVVVGHGRAKISKLLGWLPAPTGLEMCAKFRYWSGLHAINISWKKQCCRASERIPAPMALTNAKTMSTSVAG